MSSPSNNLRKIKRSPLPYRPQVPFRHTVSDDGLGLEESPFPTTATSAHNLFPLDDCTHRTIIDGLKMHHKSVASEGRGTGRGKGGPPAGTSDAELLVSMAQRLGAVEKELLNAKREVIEKNESIHRLESKLAMLEASQNWEQAGQLKYMYKQCQALQNQVDEMEEFLNDYGMVWVGSCGAASHDNHMTSGGAASRDNHTTSSGAASCDNHTTSIGTAVWSPTSSLALGQEVGLEVRQEIRVDFDAIIRNVKELNVLAGEGSSEVTRTPKGAQLKVLDHVPITLYNNGLSLFAGPFRPYSDPSTQQVIRDLTDGYFPSELQHRYPEGVPLHINDQREVLFKQKLIYGEFPGSGHLLGGDNGPSRLLPTGSVLRGSPPKSQALKETSELIGQRQLSLDQFLGKLPQSVVRSGRVLDIRAGVRDTLKGGKTSIAKGVPKLQLVETGALEEIRSRLELAEDDRPPTPAHLTTLRIKTEDGQQTYVLKMKSSETIGDIRNYVDKLRQSEGHSCDYLLKRTFPAMTLDNLSATILHCKLVPSATLYMTKKQTTS